MKQSARHVLKSLSANCPELLQGYSKLIVPYIFLEKCQLGKVSLAHLFPALAFQIIFIVIRGDEASKKRNEEWCELWNEIVPSKIHSFDFFRSTVLFVLCIEP